MRQFKLLLISISLVAVAGCANKSKADSVQALTQWDKTYAACSNQEKQSKFSFPKDTWFDALTMNDKKRVTLFLYQTKMYKCSGTEQETLKEALNRENNQYLLNMFNGLGLFKKPDEKLILGIDETELDRFEKQIDVFNLSTIAAQQGFRSK